VSSFFIYFQAGEDVSPFIRAQADLFSLKTRAPLASRPEQQLKIVHVLFTIRVWSIFLVFAYLFPCLNQATYYTHEIEHCGKPVENQEFDRSFLFTFHDCFAVIIYFMRF
jgi:hypothetical protein